MSASRHEKLPPLSQRPVEPLDRIWWAALPVFYLVMTGYGITAALFPLKSVSYVQGLDRAAIFGGTIAVVGLLLVVGSARSVFWQRPQFEMWATLAFLILMGTYMGFLYVASVDHEAGARPGSSFLPLLFSIFPFTRLLAIVRTGRVRWLRDAAVRFKGVRRP